MSKKYESKSNQSSDSTLSNIKTNEFDVKKYKLEPIRDLKDSQDSAQYNAFPRYLYNKKGKNNDKFESEGERFIVITNPIKISKGGLPRLDGKWRKTDNDCLYFWLPLLDTDEGGNDLLKNILEPLDEYNDKKITQEGNKGFVTRVDEKTGKLVTLKNLKYVPCIKEFTPGTNDEDETNDDTCDDDVFKKDIKMSIDEYKRIKVRLATLFEKDVDKNSLRKIKTRVYINDSDGNPKEETENVESLDDLRKLFVWNCTAQFALEFNKFWVMKSLGEDKMRKCSIGVKCVQMYISEIPEIAKISNELGMSVFGIRPKNTKAIENSDTKLNTILNAKTSDKDLDKEESDKEESDKESDKEESVKEESDKDSDKESDKEYILNETIKLESDDEELEEEKPKKTKKVEKKKNDSDDEVDEVEEEKPKKTEKITKNDKSKSKVKS